MNGQKIPNGPRRMPLTWKISAVIAPVGRRAVSRGSAWVIFKTQVGLPTSPYCAGRKEN